MGRETDTMGFSAAQTLDLGTESESMGHTEQVTLPQGSETDSMAASASGSATFPQGQESDSMAFSVAQTRSLGQESASFQAGAVADLAQVTTTATAVTPNTPAWTNPTNAQGAINGTEAAHTGAATADTSFDATLRCSGLVVTATPSGFTRNSVKIRVVHRWDLVLTLPVTGILDAVMTIDLRDSADVLIANLVTRTAAIDGTSQSTLLQEAFDISGLVSEAQLGAGVKVDFHFVGVGIVSTVHNVSWNVDACHLVANFSRTGIS